MKALLCTLLLTLVLAPGQLLASNARDYIPLPPGTTLVCFYGKHIFGDDLYVDHDKVNDDMDFAANIGIFRPIHYMQFGPFTADPQAIIPFGDTALGGKHSSGLGDITLAATIWFLDNKEDKFFWAYTPYLTLPTGEYDHDKPVNMGTNRWATKHEMCLGKGFGDSVWLEWVANVEFFDDNDDTLDSNGNTMTSSKKPLFGTEVHLSYDFTKELFGSVDYYLSHGGETELDGHDMDDTTTTHTLGCSLMYMLTETTQFMLDYQRDISVENGIRTDALQARLSFVF